MLRRQFGIGNNLHLNVRFAGRVGDRQNRTVRRTAVRFPRPDCLARKRPGRLTSNAHGGRNRFILILDFGYVSVRRSVRVYSPGRTGLCVFNVFDFERFRNKSIQIRTHSRTQKGQ